MNIGLTEDVMRRTADYWAISATINLLCLLGSKFKRTISRLGMEELRPSLQEIAAVIKDSVI
jgi:hypothetical protein